MILKLLLNTQIMWMIFIKILKSIWSHLMIWLLMSLVIKNWIIQYRKETKYFCFYQFLSYFAAPKNITLNSTHYFIMKIPNKRELQQIYFIDIDFLDFMNFYKKCTAKPYSFLVIDTLLALENSSCFRKNLLERI